MCEMKGLDGSNPPLSAKQSLSLHSRYRHSRRSARLRTNIENTGIGDTDRIAFPG